MVIPGNEPSTESDPAPGPTDALDADGQLVLLRQYRETGDRRALESLVEQMLPWVRKVANRYSGRGFDSDDLVQVGSVGLLKAIERFDLNRGVQLTTYAEPTVVGEIRRHFRDYGWMVRPPRDLQELNAEVARAIDSLTSELKRSPTVTEISEHVATSEEAVLEAIHAGGGYSPAPLEPPTEEGRVTPPEHPALATEDDGLARSELRQAIGGGLAGLSERDRQVVHLRFFQDLTQSEIAEQIGVSQMQVSRIIRFALRAIRQNLGAEVRG